MEIRRSLRSQPCSLAGIEKLISEGKTPEHSEDLISEGKTPEHSEDLISEGKTPEHSEDVTKETAKNLWRSRVRRGAT